MTYENNPDANPEDELNNNPGGVEASAADENATATDEENYGGQSYDGNNGGGNNGENVSNSTLEQATELNDKDGFEFSATKIEPEQFEQSTSESLDNRPDTKLENDPTDNLQELEELEANENRNINEEYASDKLESAAGVEEQQLTEQTLESEPSPGDDSLFASQQKEDIKRGDDRTYAQIGRLGEDFEPIASEIITHIRDVFVEVPEYERFQNEATQSNDQFLFFVTGQPHTGRYAASIRLALELTKNFEQRQIYQYLPVTTSADFQLKKLVRDAIRLTDTEDGLQQTVPNNSVVIVRDVFSHSNTTIQQDLSGQGLHTIEAILRKCNIRFILTTTSKTQIIDTFNPYKTQNNKGELYAMADKQFPKLYSKHLKDKFPDSELQEGMINLLNQDNVREALASKLKTPKDIEELFRRIEANDPQDAASVLDIADMLMASRSQQQQMRAWFESLRDYEKLYVLFAVLLRDMNLYDLDEIYDSTIAVLREEGLASYRDPRRLSVEQLLDRIRMDRSRDIHNKLEFVGQRRDDYREEVHRQIDNHYRLLWSSMDILLKKLYELDDRYGIPSVQRRHRHIIAIAIAQIGAYRLNRLHSVLIAIARSDKVAVAASAVEIFKYLAQDVKYHNFILEVLDGWIRTREFSLMWISILTISNIYGIVARLAEPPEDTDSTQADGIMATHDIAQNTKAKLIKLYTTLCNEFANFNDEAFVQKADDLLQQEKQLYLQNNPQAKGNISQHIQNKFQQDREDFLRTMKLVWSDQLFLSIIEGLENIASDNLDDVISLIKEWFGRSPNGKRWQIARLVSNYLYQQTTEETGRLIDEQQIKLLQLLPEMLVASTQITSDIIEWMKTTVIGDKQMRGVANSDTRKKINQLSFMPIYIAMQTLAVWYDTLDRSNQEEDIELWDEKIYPAVLEMVNRSSSDTRPLLVNAIIRYWIRSPHVKIHRQGMLLLRRIKSLSGVIGDITDEQAGIILLDASHRDDRDYRNFVYELLQRLAPLSTLHIYHLGTKPEQRIVLGGLAASMITPNENAVTKNVTENGSTTTVEIASLRIGNNPPLLLKPLLEPVEVDPIITPKTSAYLLTLNRRAIYDIDDVIDEQLKDEDEASEQKSQPDVKSEISLINPAMLDDVEPEYTPDTNTSWEWAGKFIFLDINMKELFEDIPQDTVSFIETTTEWNDALRSRIEAAVEQQLIQNLQQLNPREQQQILDTYVEQSQTDITDATKLITNAQSLIDDPAMLTPRFDVTRGIVYGMLAYARKTRRILSEVIKWLGADEKELRTLGMACTQALYQFFNDADVDTRSDLLALLPHLSMKEITFGEIEPLVDILLDWAGDSVMVQRLLMPQDDDEAALVVTINNLNSSALHSLQQRVEREEALIAFQKQFIKFGIPLPDFLTRCNRVLGYYRRLYSEPEKAFVPDDLTKDTAEELYELLHYDQKILDWVVDQLRLKEKTLLDESNHNALLEEYDNRSYLLGAMRLQIAGLLGNAFPELPKGQFYVVIMVDVSIPAGNVRHATLTILRQVLNELKALPQSNVIVPIVHRLGHEQITLSFPEFNTIPEIKYNDNIIWTLNRTSNYPPTTNYAPTLGPILSRYKPEQVGLVIMISMNTILDIEDWYDNDTWRNKYLGYSISVDNVFPETIPTLPSEYFYTSSKNNNNTRSQMNLRNALTDALRQTIT